jgi:mono/diheme cytochrome c family protein
MMKSSDRPARGPGGQLAPRGRGPESGSLGSRSARYRVTILRARQLVCLVVSPLIAVSLVVSTRSLATASPGAATAAAETVAGKRLYRQFCGQCHALAQALAAGFGSSTSGGLGTNGGPSFNDLRVSFELSIVAVSEPTGGHEAVSTKMSWKQLNEVATYIASVTRHNPIPATSTDG